MKRSRRLLPFLAVLALATPSCVLAIGNDGTGWYQSEHPHEGCEECAELGLHDEFQED